VLVIDEALLLQNEINKLHSPPQEDVIDMGMFLEKITEKKIGDLMKENPRKRELDAQQSYWRMRDYALLKSTTFKKTKNGKMDPPVP